MGDFTALPNRHAVQHGGAPSELKERTSWLHEAAIADHFGGQNGGKTMLGAFLGYLRRLPSKGAVQQLNLGILAVYGAGVRSGSP